jgi:hypothetical protein
MPFYIIVIVVTVLLIGLISFFMIRKAKEEVWEGQLIDKRKETSGSDDAETTTYCLYVKTIDGLDKKIYAKKKFFDTVIIGDNLIKTKGETYPRKRN